MTTTTAPSASPRDALELFVSELPQTIAAVSTTQDRALRDVAARVSGARRVFVVAAGRSGLALRMTATRLMPLGLQVHVVGDVTAPSIA